MATQPVMAQHGPKWAKGKPGGTLLEIFPGDSLLANALGDFAEQISGGPPKLATIVRELVDDGKPAQCFVNVEKAARKAGGGRPITGWYFFDATPINDPRVRYLCAVHHCTFERPDTRKVVCVSPIDGRRPIEVNSKLFFLVDLKAAPEIRTGYSPIPLANRFFPITQDSRTITFVEEMNKEAKRKFEEQLRSIDSL